MIGAGATIVPGVRVGEIGLVRAGAVVVDDVPADGVLTGLTRKAARCYVAATQPGIRPVFIAHFSTSGQYQINADWSFATGLGKSS